MRFINLQNTPTKAGLVCEPVSFNSRGSALRGNLYRPTDTARPLPAVIVTGAWTTVKEQMSGTYARELAARGYAALAFDFTGWGASEGTPRFVEDPEVKTADIQAAATFLASQNVVDRDQILGLGICASSGYMAAAVADTGDLQKVALVAPWLHNPALAEEMYGGAAAVAKRIAASDAEDAAQTVLVSASTTDDAALMYQAPYYTEQHRGLISAYDTKFSVASWRPWLTYDALASAERLDKPMLMVGSPSIALPAGVKAYQARMTAPLEKRWLGEDVTQFDFYDREDVVTATTDAVAAFFTPDREHSEL